MNVNSILEYKRDPAEDYYKLLGCDRYSTSEQISTEFKIRAKECHPDKSTGRSESNPEMFQKLLKVTTVFVNVKLPYGILKLFIYLRCYKSLIQFIM